MAKIKLFNNSTNTVDDIDQSQVNDAVASGTYSFIPGKSVDVVAPDGTPGKISPEEAAQAISAGFSFDSAESKAERKLRAEYDDKNVESLLYGAARGLSLGISDPLITASGLASSEHLRMLEEANPNLSMAGEIGGNVAGILATGGTGAVAKGAGLATKATIGAGQLAERAVAKGLQAAGVSASKSLAQKIIADAVPRIAGAAAEGSLVGIGDVVSEHALGRAELNAENLVAGATLGGVIGGAGSVLFQGLEKAIPLAAKGVANTAKYIHNNLTSPERMAMDLYGATEAKVAKLIARDKITPSDISEITLRKFTPESGKDFVTNFHDVLARDSEVLRGLSAQADGVVGNQFTVDELINKQGLSKRIQDIIDQSSSVSEASEIRGIRRLKKDIDEGGFLPKRPTELLDEAGVPKRVLVPDESVGPFQSAKYFLDKLDDLAKFDKGEGPNKLQELARDLRRDVRSQINETLERVAQDNQDLDPAVKQLFQGIRGMNRDMHISLKLKDFVDRKEAAEFTKKFFNFTTAMRVAAGGAIGDVPGAIIGLGMKFASMDGIQLAKLRLLSQMEKNGQGVAKKLSDAVTNFAETSSKRNARIQFAATKALTDISYDLDKKKRSNETKEVAFERIQKELQGLETYEAKERLILERTKTLREVAPETAAQLGLTLTSAVEFLRTKIPQDPNDGKYLNPAFRKWKPSKFELDKFERYTQAVEDPVSVIEKFGRGVVDREGIETLQTVYPEIYTEFQNKVVTKVAELKEPLPYSKRIQLKNFLDISVDPSTESSSIVALQQTFAPPMLPPEQAQSGRVAPNPIRGKLEVNNLATDTQDLLTNSELVG